MHARTLMIVSVSIGGSCAACADLLSVCCCLLFLYCLLFVVCCLLFICFLLLLSVCCFCCLSMSLVLADFFFSAFQFACLSPPLLTFIFFFFNFSSLPSNRNGTRRRFSQNQRCAKQPSLGLAPFTPRTNSAAAACLAKTRPSSSRPCQRAVSAPLRTCRFTTCVRG